MINKNIMQMFFVVIVALLALILNAEGKLLANDSRLLIVLVVLFVSGGITLNFFQINRWRRGQLDDQAYRKSSNTMIVDDRRRIARHYKRWLVAMPFLYIIGLLGNIHKPLSMRLVFTVFSICAYSYVLFVYNKVKQS